MIKLLNKATGAEIGTLTEAQLKFLTDQLEEESTEDTDYWLPRAQIEVFKDNGADADLIRILEAAMGSNEDIEITWQKTE